MANVSISAFKSKLVGGGARANLFRVTLGFPTGIATGGDPELASFLIKASSLPPSVVNPIIIPFRGRQAPIAGDRVFQPWSFTVINDTGFEIRSAFELWLNGINAHEQNTGLTNPSDYSADFMVEQLDKSGASVKQYVIRSGFPTVLSEITVSNDSENTIEEFSVEISYLYWTSDTTS